jgi:hypothetical protein
LGSEQVDSGDSTFSTQTKVTVVSFLFVGNKTNGVDLHRRNISEQTSTTHILAVDNERFFFAADSTAFRATDGSPILHCDITLKSRSYVLKTFLRIQNLGYDSVLVSLGDVWPHPCFKDFCFIISFYVCRFLNFEHKLL